MSDRYRARVLSIEDGNVRLEVLQILPDTCDLRAIAERDPYVKLDFLAVRLLADAPGASELRSRLGDSIVLDPKRFSDVMIVSELEELVLHDLVRLIDHDRFGLRTLVDRTDWAELDPEVYTKSYGGGSPIDRANPSSPQNFIEEARILVRLRDARLASGLAVGMKWDSAAFGVR